MGARSSSPLRATTLPSPYVAVSIAIDVFINNWTIHCTSVQRVIEHECNPSKKKNMNANMRYSLVWDSEEYINLASSRRADKKTYSWSWSCRYVAICSSSLATSSQAAFFSTKQQQKAKFQQHISSSSQLISSIIPAANNNSFQQQTAGTSSSFQQPSAA